MRFLLLTGMSGAGKTTALRYLEDMGVFCVDNLPPMMMLRLMEAFQPSGTLRHKVAALAVDVRSGEFFDALAVSQLIRETRALGYSVEILFLEATDDVLVRRYKETRRDHPLAGESVSLTEAIASERELLQPLRETASYVVDTSQLSPRVLQRTLQSIVSAEVGDLPFRIEIMSFGFKRGLPRQGDLVFDVRFLPNPFYIDGLGIHTGLDEDVRTFVLNHPVTEEFLTRVKDMLTFLIPHYREEGKHRLVIAVGCTGGAHRSVAIAEAVGAFLRDMGHSVDVNHRDLDVEQAHWKTRGEGVG